MKPAAAPKLPDDATPWQRLDIAFRTALTIPKETLLKEEARLKKLRARKRARRRAKKPS